MANSGYKINPAVVQYFTSGPNSGSPVSSSYYIEFDVNTDFTSSIICQEEYNYRILDTINCPPEGVCIRPHINDIQPLNCDSGYNYIYNIRYNINNTTSSIPNTIIVYSNHPSFVSSSTISVMSQSIVNTTSSMDINIDISDMNNLPLNGNTSVYFRAYNSCSLNGTSSYDDFEAFCSEPEEDLYIVILAKNTNYANACDQEESGTTTIDGFVGNSYYINESTFSSCTKIYTYNPSNPTFPSASWYTNGEISKYWNGTQFTNQINCP